MNERKFRCQVSNQRPLFENLYKNIVPELLAAHGDLEITIRPYKAKRSYEQNRRLWSLYNQIAEQVWLDGRRFSADMWHEYFKQQFIGCDERVLPNGEIQKIGLSTTQLNTQQMADYQTRIEAWAAEQGVIFEY